MRIRWIRLAFAAMVAFACLRGAIAQTTAGSNPKKTEAAAHVDSGKAESATHRPDLTGVWANITKWGPTFNANEGPSFQPWAEAKWKANKNTDPGQPAITNGRVDLDPTVTSCFPTGIPRLMTEVMPFEIMQVRDRVVILFEKDYAVMHVWTDGRALPKDPDPTYMGQSVGKWDGDSLIVDTIGLKDITWIDRQGHPHSDALHVTGRFHRASHDQLQIDWTFDDPKAFTKPWTGQTIYRLHPDWTLEEFYACEDRWLHGGESLEQKAVKGNGQ